MNRTVAIILGAVVLLCCCVGGIGGVVAFGGAGAALVGVGSETTGAADKFVRAMKDENWDDAYAMLHPGFRTQFPNSAALRTFITQRQVQPESWNFNSFNQNNDTATVKGTFKTKGGREGTIEIEMVKLDGSWKITRFNFDT